MKKLCLLLALLLLLSGCQKQTAQPPTTEAVDTGVVRFDIYAINDLHGKLADTDHQPGVDELTTYLKQARQTGNTIALSTGDMWQGTSESNSTKGKIVTEWMNELGFAAMTLGGHEYDWGEEQIRQNRQLASFPFLAINVYDRATDKQADYCQSSVTVEAEGAKIGIIGAIGDCYGAIDSQQTQNVYFKTGPELTALVKAEAQRLRGEGADFIIYAIHDGYTETSPGEKAMAVTDGQIASYYDTALSEGYVELVFEADTHYSYVLQDSRGVYHLQSGGNNSGISHAGVLIDKGNDSIFVFEAELLSSGKYSHVEEDPVVSRLLEKYADDIGAVTDTLGNNGQYRSGSDVCQLVAQLYCAKGVEKWGDAYDIVLGGGYLSCRSPGYLPAGEVSYSQLYSLLPFDNEITLCSIRGRDLISKFLETDNPAYYIQTTDHAENIDPDGIYYVVADSYTANYAYNNMTVIDTYAEDIFARDLVAEHIASGNLA